MIAQGSKPASIRARAAAAGAWLSAKYPFVWRTRALLWVGIGLTGSGAADAYARIMDIRTETVPGLTAVLFWLSWWTYLVVGALLLLLIDVVRRTTPVFSPHHAVRLFGCVAVSVFALVLPQYVFITAVLPRIALLETESDLAALLKGHGDNKFWQCWPDNQTLSKAVNAHRDLIAQDLARYGLTTDFSMRRLGLGCTAPAYWALIARAPQGDLLGIGIFKDRVTNIDAAQRYRRGDRGAYEAVALRHVWVMLTIAVFSGALATLMAGTMLMRIRALAGGRRLLGRWTWRTRLTSRLDRQLASRWPVVWSSRVLVSVPQFLILPALMTFRAGPNWMLDGVTAILWVNALTVVAGIFWAFRIQEKVRSLPARLPQEIGVFLIHWTVFGICSAVAALFGGLGNSSEPLLQSTGVMLVLGLLLCGPLQAARNGSAIMASGALVFALALLSPAVVGLALLGINGDAPMVAVIVGGTMCVGALARYSVWREARPAVRRFLIGSFLVLGPVPGVFLTLATLAYLDPGPGDVTASGLIAIIVLGMASMILSLRLTEDARRALAFTAR